MTHDKPYREPWRERLLYLQRTRDEDEAQIANRDAAAWPTCAAGELLDLHDDQQPGDPIVLSLGAKFEEALQDRDFKRALRVLDELEARVAFSDVATRVIDLRALNGLRPAEASFANS